MDVRVRPKLLLANQDATLATLTLTASSLRTSFAASESSLLATAKGFGAGGDAQLKRTSYAAEHAGEGVARLVATSARLAKGVEEAADRCLEGVLDEFEL
ncbi:hypothetical protein HDU98_011765 [Podochytrium sp. JEL0797]|nr:hypothetical protein HDU98_011765 [Podochytrium sp. JEL0797]